MINPSSFDRNYFKFTVYDDDYIEMYNQTFDAMFDNEWEVLSEETIKDWTVPEFPTAGEKSTRFQYTQWVIEYTDENNEKQEFVLHNRYSLNSQIERYIENYVAEYYTNNFINTYFGDVQGVECDLFASMGSVYSDTSTDEGELTYSKIKKYMSDLETPSGTINLTEITPYNVFDKCPIYINVDLWIDYEYFSKEQVQTVIDGRKAMINEMNDYLDGNLNVDATTVLYFKGEDKSYREIDDINFYNFGKGIYLVNGEVKECTIGREYEKLVYQSYKGIFWD